MIAKDQERLISRYLDGVETPEDLERLDEWVRTNPEVCRELILMAAQDVMIRQTLAEKATALEHLETGDAAQEERSPALAPEFVTAASGAWRSLGVWGAMAATLALAFLGVWRWAGSPVRDAGSLDMVVVEAGGDVIRIGGGAVKQGDALRAGDTVATGVDGSLRYAYQDGTFVGMGTNSILVLGPGSPSPDKAVRLARGTLTASVRKQPANRRMTFATPQAVATVLGTALSLEVTPRISVLSVQTGQVQIATAERREFVSAGESARVRNGIIRKFEGLQPPSNDEEDYVDGAILLQDSFEKGFENWLLYTGKGEGAKGDRNTWQTTEAQCPDIRIVRADRDGRSCAVAELVGKEPQGQRVGIVTKDLGRSVHNAFSMSYEYTYEGRQRRAMEGIEIDMGWRNQDPPDLGKTRTQLARPAGEWNQVRWEYIRKTAPSGRGYFDSRLYFNGELIGSRSDYCDDSTPWVPALRLEVVEGQFRFDHVVIRELRKAGDPVARGESEHP